MSVAFSPDWGQVASASAAGTLGLWEVAWGDLLAMLVPLRDGWAAIQPDGAYKLDGVATGEVWYVSGLCRFEPGELDSYVPAIRRLRTDAPLLA